MGQHLARVVGQRIRERRQSPELKSGPLTQEQLAGEVGVRQPSVSDWENGRSLPSVPLLLELERVLELPLAELLAGEPKSKSKKKAVAAS